MDDGEPSAGQPHTEPQGGRPPGGSAGSVGSRLPSASDENENQLDGCLTGSSGAMGRPAGAMGRPAAAAAEQDSLNNNAGWEAAAGEGPPGGQDLLGQDRPTPGDGSSRTTTGPARTPPPGLSSEDAAPSAHEDVRSTAPRADGEEESAEGHALAQPEAPTLALQSLFSLIRGEVEQLDSRALPLCLHQIAESYFQEEDYEKAMKFIQLERLYHEQLLANLSAIQEQWETKWKTVQPRAVTSPRNSEKGFNGEDFERLTKFCTTHQDPLPSAFKMAAAEPALRTEPGGPQGSGAAAPAPERGAGPGMEPRAERPRRADAPGSGPCGGAKAAAGPERPAPEPLSARRAGEDGEDREDREDRGDREDREDGPQPAPPEARGAAAGAQGPSGDPGASPCGGAVTAPSSEPTPPAPGAPPADPEPTPPAPGAAPSDPEPTPPAPGAPPSDPEPTPPAPGAPPSDPEPIPPPPASRPELQLPLADAPGAGPAAPQEPPPPRPAGSAGGPGGLGAPEGSAAPAGRAGPDPLAGREAEDYLSGLLEGCLRGAADEDPDLLDPADPADLADLSPDEASYSLQDDPPSDGSLSPEDPAPPRIQIAEVVPAAGLVSILKKRNDAVGGPAQMTPKPAKRRVRFQEIDDTLDQDEAGSGSCLLLVLLCIATVLVSVGGTALYCAFGDLESPVCTDFAHNVDFYYTKLLRGVAELKHWVYLS